MKDKIEDGSIFDTFPITEADLFIPLGGVKKINTVSGYLLIHGLRVGSYKKPKSFHLFMMKRLLGWEWEDYG